VIHVPGRRRLTAFPGFSAGRPPDVERIGAAPARSFRGVAAAGRPPTWTLVPSTHPAEAADALLSGSDPDKGPLRPLRAGQIVCRAPCLRHDTLTRSYSPRRLAARSPHRPWSASVAGRFVRPGRGLIFIGLRDSGIRILRRHPSGGGSGESDRFQDHAIRFRPGFAPCETPASC
jgi:hypothetical protein